MSIINLINRLYDKSGFFEKYGGSLILTIIIIFIFFYYISYYYILNHLEPIKADWVNQRCKPYVLPFASIINKPDDQSSSEFTSGNFTYCIQSIVADLSNVFLAPIYYLTNVTQEILQGIEKALDSTRYLFSNMRDSIKDVSKEIMSRILNVMTSLQVILIKVRDFTSKTNAVMTSSIYTLLGSYDTLRSLVGAIFQMFILILLMLLAIIVPLLFIPFGFGVPIAAIFIAIFITIAVVLTLVYIIAGSILHLHITSIPGLP